MKKVAIVGFGFMGKTHYGAWKKCPGAKVVAVCDSNLAQIKAKAGGNIKGVANDISIPKSVKIWESVDDMLAAGGFDIVDVTLPTFLHPEVSIAALKAGYHVLCEKPMALALKDCDRMLAAAKAAKRQLLIVQCVRFFPENVYIRDLVRSGKYGKVFAADFSRFIAPPKWSPRGAGWFLDESKSGGVLLDAHIHDADYILDTFGRPDSVSCVVHRNADGFPDHTTSTFTYDGAVITSDSSYAAASSLVWDATGRVFFEKATVYFGPFYRNALTVYPDGGKPFSPKLAKATGYEAEVRYFLDQVERGRPGDILTADDARNTIEFLAFERKSASTGRIVRL